LAAGLRVLAAGGACALRRRERTVRKGSQEMSGRHFAPENHKVDFVASNFERYVTKFAPPKAPK